MSSFILTDPIRYSKGSWIRKGEYMIIYVDYEYYRKRESISELFPIGFNYDMDNWFIVSSDNEIVKIQVRVKGWVNTIQISEINKNDDRVSNDYQTYINGVSVNKTEDKMSNEEFPISNKLGLKAIYKLEQGYGHYVFNGEAVFKAKDVEAIFQSAQVVYGNPNGNWNSNLVGSDNKKGLLLCVEPIKKKTKAEAALELLEKLSKDHDHVIQPEWHVKEAKRILEMKDEV